LLILVLDSSTGVVTAGVARSAEGGREVLTEISIPSRGASETLLPAVHAALNLAGTNLSEVNRILVGVGPGTFTGIRIALAAARSLSLAIGAPLSRNSTLAALAAPALLDVDEPEVLAVLDARRRQVFAQRFGVDGARGEIYCTVPEELRAMFLAERVPAEERTLLVGDGAVRYREALSGLGRIPPGASPLHRVTAVGHVLSADLTPVPAPEVVPLYIRKPDAETRRNLNPWSKS
jgi:tRNA threonylcarbamoyladenosine biosynthesis protein TsaB